MLANAHLQGRKIVMKKLFVLLTALVMVFAIAITAGPNAVHAAPAGTEEVKADGSIYFKTVGMPYYGVPEQVPTTNRSDHKNGILSRTLASVQFTPASDGVGWTSQKLLLCDGSVRLNEDVSLVDILEVWPEGRTPGNVLAVLDEGTTWVPLGIESWADLYNNSTGWPSGTTEDTFVVQASGLQWLKDPSRNPFRTPREAWGTIFIELDRRYGQAVDFADKPIVDTDDVYVRQVTMKKGRKLFIVAQRNDDCSYSYFFLKKYNKSRPDYSETNSLADLELAIAYLKGK